MSNRRVRVAVNGYGVIGKRVVDAVKLQTDMEFVGVSDIAHDFRIKTALKRDIPIYASLSEKVKEMKEAGVPVAGTLADLLSQIDVIVDCTPKGIGARNLETYKNAGVKAIFQGGEGHELTGHSFVAQANYESALKRDTTRVVSCNTTSIVRTLSALRNADLLKKARGVLIRRATDPWESDHSGIMNTVVPEIHIPSHQSPDAKTIIPDLDVITIAAKAAHTQNHVHFWSIELKRKVERQEVIQAFKAAPRIALINAADGIVAVNSTVELMRDLGRPRNDMWEVGLWEDSLVVQGNELFYSYQVDNEAIAIPENIDAIRALMGVEPNAAASIEKTDHAMGISKSFT